MKIEIISAILDDLMPESLFMLSGVPTDQKSLEEFAHPSPTGVTWSDVEAKYESYESKFATAEMRTLRDELLKESDVEVLPDRTPSDEIKTYRQALRDLPSTEVPTYDTEGKLAVNWPVKP